MPFHSLPAGIFTMVMELSDRYLLEFYLSTAEVGLYSAGKKMGMLGLTIVMGFNMGWTPYFLKQGENEDARIQFSKIATLFLGLMGFVTLLVSLWVSNIMRIHIGVGTLIGAEFWDCEPVVKIILFGYFFFGAYVIQLPGIYIKEITKWVPIFRICGALCLIIFCVILIPRIGFIGAAYSVLFAFVLMSIAIYIRTHNIYKVPYNWRGIFYPIVFLTFIQVYEFDFLSKIALSISYPLFWYFIATNEDEKNGVKRLIKW